MTQPETAETKTKKPIGADMIIPLGGLGFTIYYFYTIIGVPRIAQMSAFFVGSILIFLTIIFTVKSIAQVRRGEADWGFGPLTAPASYINKRLVLLILTMGYIATVPQLGFTITTFIFLAASMLLLSDGKKARLIVPLAAILSLGGFLLFVVAFKTRFPEGPFEKLMGGLF